MMKDWLVLSTGFNRGISILVAILAAFIILNSAGPGSAQKPEHVSLAGQLLVASPTIGDPRFDRTVILMVQHNPNGAFGIIINLPRGEIPLASILQSLDDKDIARPGKGRVFAGGPVQPEVGFVVHSADYQRSETIAIDGRVAVTSSREILRDIGNNKGPNKSLIAFGYAGWGAGQLEGELGRRIWFTAPADPKLILPGLARA